MAVTDPGVALRRFDFSGGALRGTHLALYSAHLVHRGDAQFETLPLAGIASVRVGFQRDTRRIGWAVALLVLALVLFAISSPIATLAAGAAADVSASGTQGVARGLLAIFRFIEGVGTLLPVVALACALGGAGLGALGWMGETVLALTVSGAERVFTVRGRDPRLLDFSEALSERIVALPR